MNMRLLPWNNRYVVGTVLAWSLCFASVLTPAVQAHAQSDDALIEMARERFQEGVRYYDQKQYDKARASFLQAYALKRHPAVLLNLAQSELRSGREADAAEHFELYLREHKEASALERQEAEKGLAAAKARVGQVDLTVDVAGAEISVDGQPRGVTPLAGPLYVEPGKRTIEAKKGSQETSTQVEVAAGRQTSASLSLGSSGAAPTPAAGDDASGADVMGPGAASESAPEEDSGESSFEVDTGAPRQSFFEWFGENELAWVGGGLAVAGLAGGIGFSLAAKSNYDAANSVADAIRQQAVVDDVANPCGAPPDDAYLRACLKFQENEDAGNRYKVLSWVGWGLAAVGVGGTLVYYFVDTQPNSESVSGPRRRLRAALVPIAAPSHQGLSLVGEF